MPTVAELRAQRADLVQKSRQILNKAESEKRALLAEEQAEFDRYMADVDTLAGSVAEAERYEKLQSVEASLSQSAGRRSSTEQPGTQESRKQPATLDEWRSTPEFRSAYGKVIRFGPEAALTNREREAVSEVRALQASLDVQGGYLITPLEVMNEVLLFVKNLLFMRQLGRVLTVPTAASLGVPSLDADPADADWTSELATGSEDSTMAFGRRELHPRPLAKRIKVSNKLLRMYPEADALVLDRLAYKFATTEENVFLNGTGANQPLGIFTASSLGISTGRDVASVTNDALGADDFINAKYKLKVQYQYSPTTRWVLHRDILKAVRKLKDANNQYLWQPAGLGNNFADGIDRLLEVPIVLSEYAPSSIADAAYVAVIGDMKFYWIADALTLQVQRLVELYAETNQIGFIGRLETDGMPVLEEAFARIKIS